MCFSPEASFVASLALIGIGITSLKLTQNSAQKLLAIIPIFFAMQQFSEGIIWLQLIGDIDKPLVFSLAKSIFLIIAYAVWPIWIPFAIFYNEKNSLKKKLLFIFLILGVFDAFFNLKGLPLNEINPVIIGNSIRYDTDVSLFYKFVYIVIVLIPLFLSTFPYIWLFGVVVGLTSVIALYLYNLTFTSVWCFASALSSFCILFSIRYHNLHTTQHREKVN